MFTSYGVIVRQDGNGGAGVHRASPYQFETTARAGQHLYTCKSIASPSDLVLTGPPPAVRVEQSAPENPRPEPSRES